MAQLDPYFLGYRQAEQERLQVQAQELASEATGSSISLVFPAALRSLNSGVAHEAVSICWRSVLGRRAGS